VYLPRNKCTNLVLLDRIDKSFQEKLEGGVEWMLSNIIDASTCSEDLTTVALLFFYFLVPVFTDVAQIVEYSVLI
jgi:hypothetical protein